MASCERASKVVDHSPYPSAERSGWRYQSRVAVLPVRGSEQARVSDAELAENDDIFHSLIASGRELTPQNPWATFGALIFQSVLLTGLIAVPLFHVEPLPKKERRTMLSLQAPRVTTAEVNKIKPPKSGPAPIPVRTPAPRPVHVAQLAPPYPVETTSEPVTGAAGLIADGALNEGSGSADSVPIPAKTPEPPPVKRIRVAARVAEANLIHDVPPQYPAEAGRERIEGTVVLVAVIGTDGKVKDVRVESGAAQLTQAAIDAVKQWRYKPYLLNGTPVEVDSRITINFAMVRG